MFEDNDEVANELSFGTWAEKTRKDKNMTIQDLVAKTGISYPGIQKILDGTTKNPRQITRDKIGEALGVTNENLEFKKINESINSESSIQIDNQNRFTLSDFDPFEDEQIPREKGVYVFYDITDRPVYIGKASRGESTIYKRIKDHQTRFWFKEPIVVKAKYIKIEQPQGCEAMEKTLIAFLGKHALINVRGVVRDEED